MGDQPLSSPIHRRLGEPLPHQLSNGTHAHLSANFFNKYSHAGPLFYVVLVRLSTGYPSLIGRLHTRYSPVRRSPPVYCYTVLPLDLHVLSLSLAFILSQDQTLRCQFVFLYPCAQNSFLSIQVFFFDGMFYFTLLLYYLSSCYVNLSKNSFLAFDSSLVKPETRFLNRNVGAKIRTLFLTSKYLKKFFLKFFSGGGADRADRSGVIAFAFRYHSLFLWPLPACVPLRFSLESGCKDRGSKINYQTFLPLFSELSGPFFVMNSSSMCYKAYFFNRKKKKGKQARGCSNLLPDTLLYMPLRIE